MYKLNDDVVESQQLGMVTLIEDGLYEITAWASNWNWIPNKETIDRAKYFFTSVNCDIDAKAGAVKIPPQIRDGSKVKIVADSNVQI